MIPGSVESLQYHEVLFRLGPSMVFDSITIQMFLEHKWKKVQHIGRGDTALYLCYLVAIAFVQKWWMVLIWTIFHAFLEILQVTRFDRITFERRIGTFRNVSTILRLFFQLAFIYSDASWAVPGEESIK